MKNVGATFNIPSRMHRIIFSLLPFRTDSANSKIFQALFSLSICVDDSTKKNEENDDDSADEKKKKTAIGVRARLCRLVDLFILGTF